MTPVPQTIDPSDAWALLVAAITHGAIKLAGSSVDAGAAQMAAESDALYVKTFLAELTQRAAN